MRTTDIAVVVYDSHRQAEDAVHRLARAGFDMKTVSILGKDSHSEGRVAGYDAGDRAGFFGKLGAFRGGLAAVLSGAARMFVPGVGRIVVQGAVAATFVGGLLGAVPGGGSSALAGALTAIGVPQDSVPRNESALKASKFLLIVHGGEDDLQRAHALLSAGVQT